MNNMLKKGLLHLTTMQRKHCSEDIVYVERSGNQIPVRAQLGQKLLHQDNGDGGFTITVTDLDVIISVEDLPQEPQKGDMILITLGSYTSTFEVCNYGNDSHWRWSDPHESCRRIHCKMVTREPVSTP